MKNTNNKIFTSICANHPELNGERYVHNHDCVGCCFDRSREWKKLNKDKVAAGAKRYGEKNKEKLKEQNAKWSKNNRERHRARTNKWRKSNPSDFSASCKKWRDNNRHILDANKSKYDALQLQAYPAWANDFFIKEIYDLAKLRTKIMGFPWHVDHIVPINSPVVCGLHWEKNLQVIPAIQNVKKSNKHWPDMPERG